MLVLRGRDLQGVTSLLATHRVQDAFGLAAFRLEPSSGRLVRVNFDGQNPAPDEPKRPATPQALQALAPTNVLVLREGRVYFEGHAAEMLHSTDEYLKKFLASAE
jgi:hypothetical protein